MIFKYYTATVFEGLFFGRARIYEHPVKVVTFEKLNYERTKIAALRLGFSPPINLPEPMLYDDGEMSNRWILQGETVEPVFSVYLHDHDPRRFFEPVTLISPDEPG